MPGFMGIRGLETARPRNSERERRDTRHLARQHARVNPEQRSWEKVQEVLRGQKGDMSAYSAHADASAQSASGDCAALLAGKISSIMSGRVAVLSFDDNLLTVQGIFASVKFRHLPVVDEASRVIGIISDRDFLRTVSPFFGTVNEQTRDKEIMMRKIGTIMTRNPICAEGDITILEAVKIMNGKKISCLPIVTGEEKILAGIVTWKDVVRLFCPAAFNARSDSVRLKAGVEVNPATSESERLRAKTSDSARLRAAASAAAAQRPSPTTQSLPPVAPPPPSASPARPRGDTETIPAPKRDATN